MREYAIETQALSKTYRHTRAVDTVQLRVARGEIFGLVGENGAGKSTLMKMLAGMSSPSEGSFTLFGKAPKEDARLYQRVGTLIEQPGLFPSLSAYENMKVKALAMGVYDPDRIRRILQLCEIDHARNKKVRSFSLGMKQRLGIALTLINDPDLLILDEPTNGIDPRGFASIRELLLRLNREEGKTIFISSHILEELSKVATVYGFMKQGRVVEVISAQELEAKSQEYLMLKSRDVKRAAAVLEQRLSIRSYRIVSEEELQIYDPIDSEVLIRTLAMQDVGIKECAYHHQSLEQYFFEKCGGGNHVESAAK